MEWISLLVLCRGGQIHILRAFEGHRVVDVELPDAFRHVVLILLEGLGAP